MKNSEAAAVFALAGGDPQVGKWLLKNRTLSPKFVSILEGAVEFASRNYTKAAELLDGIEPLKFPGHLGGSLALVKAMLVAKTDPKKAADLFAKSKLLVPGTLIEEAALRRSLVFFKAKKDLPKLVATSGSYYRQFGRSVFGPVFDQDLATAIVKFEDDALEMHQNKLVEAVRQTPVNRQKKIYLMLAKNAVVNGKMAFARFTSSNATKVRGTDRQAEARANLYMAAANVVSGKPDQALGALESIDPKILSSDDRAIMQGASKIVTAIAQWPPTEMTDVAAPQAESPEGSGNANGILARVKPLILEVDGILEKLKE
ncbi:MAG: hypothetical protein HKN05_11540 [Rhizobiales bacterium]|nr:hypothetical protein [Hyphomicrobiales bacterium]